MKTSVVPHLIEDLRAGDAHEGVSQLKVTVSSEAAGMNESLRNGQVLHLLKEVQVFDERGTAWSRFE